MDENKNLFFPYAKALKNSYLARSQLPNAFLDSALIGIFEAAIQQVDALTVWMPIVVNMGAIAGCQTLTPIILGVNINHVSSANVGALMSTKCKVGGVNTVI